MADFFKEILTDIDKLSDEQVNQLMAALEVKRAGGQTTKDSIKENDEIPLACPHCGSISLKRHGKAGGRQRYRCKKDYPAEDVQALHELHSAIMSRWNPDNPMGLDETLLAMKSYAPFHHLYAVSIVFAEVSNMSEMVPRPSKVLAQLKECGMMDTIINIAGKTLNRAFKNANSKAVAENRVFSPQNWIKSKASIVSLTEALRVRLDAMEDDETNLGAKVQSCCKLEKQDFESRWTAD